MEYGVSIFQLLLFFITAVGSKTEGIVRHKHVEIFMNIVPTDVVV